MRHNHKTEQHQTQNRNSDQIPKNIGVPTFSAFNPQKPENKNAKKNSPQAVRKEVKPDFTVEKLRRSSYKFSNFTNCRP